MNNINYSPNQSFYDFSLNEKDFIIHQIHKFDYIFVNDEQLTYFISKLDDKSKNTSSNFTPQQIKNVIYKKRLDNLNAIQNGVVYKNGNNDRKIQLKNYKDYYHLIFEYDVNKLEQIKNILNEKYNIEKVNLYQFDQKMLIYIFDRDSNFEAKINSPLFSNLNNRINNYNKENLINQKLFICDLPALHLFSSQVLYCDYYNGITAIKFNNIFDQNWYNLFCQNIKLFFDQITK